MFFFFNDTATTEIYTLSLHDALPISHRAVPRWRHRTSWTLWASPAEPWQVAHRRRLVNRRPEEHTSELQSPCNHVCRLLLDNKIPPRTQLREDLHPSDEPRSGLLRAP